MVNNLTRENLTTYQDLIRNGYEPGKILTFLLDSEGVTKADIARSCNVSPPYVTKALSSRRIPTKIKTAIAESIGFNPWE